MRQYQYQQFTKLYEITVTASPGEWFVDHSRPVPTAVQPQRDLSSYPVISGFEATNVNEWQSIEWRSAKRKVVCHPEAAQAVLLAEVDATPPEQWLAQDPHRVLPRRPRRDAGAWTPPFIVFPEATSISEWQSQDSRRTFTKRSLAILSQQQRERSIFLPEFIPGYVGGRNWVPRGWTPRGWDRPLAAATPIGQWQPMQGRYVPRQWLTPRRDQIVFIQLVEEPSSTVDQWNSYQPTQFRLRPPQRDYTAQTPRIITDPTSVDQWQPIEPPHFKRRRSSRPETLLVQMVEFPEPELPEWFPYDPHRVRPIRPTRDYSVIVQLVDVQPSPVDQWQGIAPEQYKKRLPSRDNSVWPVISGFEATPLTQWEPKALRVVPRHTVRRWPASQFIEIIQTPGTTVREWLGNDPRRLRVRKPNRYYVVGAVEPVPGQIQIIHNVMDVSPSFDFTDEILDVIIEIDLMG